MRFASLGSGSEGNGLVVEVGTTRVMIDCGFGVRDTATRLARLGLAPSDLAAILVTHEHADHFGGVSAFAAKYDIPVWLTFGTLDVVDERIMDVPRVYGFDSQDVFAVGAVEVRPFPVPHDAREPAQFVFGDGQDVLGVLTDAGCITPTIVRELDGCNALVIECNHDSGLLAQGDYLPSLKQRIAGRFGHLDNDAAAGLLGRIARDKLRHVVAAHLSESNNRPALARAALAGVLNCSQDWIGVADQEAGLDWRQLR